jgi:hypothetical protein
MLREIHIEKEGKTMQSLKKSMLLAFMTVFVASLAIVPAHAQTARVAADVPFDFAVGSQLMKAGSYHIETQGTGLFLAFSPIGGRTTYALPHQGSGVASVDGQPHLVFNRYGSETFLTRIVLSDGQTFELPRSNREKEILSGRTNTLEQVEVPAGSTR